MALHLLKALFVLLMAAVGYTYLKHDPGPFGPLWSWAVLAIAVTLAVIVLVTDILSSRRKLAFFSAATFGLLLGLLVSFALGSIVGWLVEQFMSDSVEKVRKETVAYLQMLLNIVCSYLAISFVMQTKDDVRFIVPYVEFARQVKGARPALLDTSILIDGRIVEVATLGLLHDRVVVPRFVLEELQTLSDCGDRLKRNRGRRGLEVLGKLQANPKLDVIVYEGGPRDEAADTVDLKLVALASEMEFCVFTTDFNLSKVAQLRGVEAINLNAVASALKPVVLPGDRMSLEIMRPGEQPGQGVGFLDDGTMVVVEQGKAHIGGGDTEVTVTSVVQTSAGRMVFAVCGDAPQLGRRPKRNSLPATPQQPPAP